VSPALGRFARSYQNGQTSDRKRGVAHVEKLEREIIEEHEPGKHGVPKGESYVMLSVCSYDAARCCVTLYYAVRCFGKVLHRKVVRSDAQQKRLVEHKVDQRRHPTEVIGKHMVRQSAGDGNEHRESSKATVPCVIPIPVHE
jgi:hypothetical protein